MHIAVVVMGLARKLETFVVGSIVFVDMNMGKIEKRRTHCVVTCAPATVRAATDSPIEVATPRLCSTAVVPLRTVAAIVASTTA